MDKQHAVKVLQQYVLRHDYHAAVREMSECFPGFSQKRRRHKGALFELSEMSFEGGAGTKWAFFYTCRESGGNRNYTTWII